MSEPQSQPQPQPQQPFLDPNFIPQVDQMITVRELTARRMKAEYEAEAARWQAQAAMNEAAAAEVDIRIGKAHLHSLNQRNRPCFYLGASLSVNDNGDWVAGLGDLFVIGHTPEAAMENFDQVWLHGHPEDNK